MHDRSSTIDGFLADTAARQPTPGGGSVAALAGALSAAIGQMVLSYSIGRKDLTQFTAQLASAAESLATAREHLLTLMVDDQSAYESLTTARRLPTDDPGRSDAVALAVADCVRIPLSIGRVALSVLTVAGDVVDRVNPWLLSDLAVAADLATATVRSAGYNVRANLKSVEPEMARAVAAAEAAEQLSTAIALVQQISSQIWAK